MSRSTSCALVFVLVMLATNPARAQLLGGALSGAGETVNGTVETVVDTVKSAVGGQGAGGILGGDGLAGLAEAGGSVGSGGADVSVNLLGGGGGAQIDLALGAGGVQFGLPGRGSPLAAVLGGASPISGDAPAVAGGANARALQGDPGGPRVGTFDPDATYRGLDNGSPRLRTILRVLQNRAWLPLVQGRQLCLRRFGIADVGSWVRPGEREHLHRLLGAFVEDIALLRQLLNRCRNGQQRRIDIGRVVGVDLRADGLVVMMVI
jgi:hypothetical protein